MQQITYTNAVIATPSASFTHDAAYGRVATMVDGTGTTTYGYHPVGTPSTLGATQLASIDGPLPNDTITYSYDELGRVTTRAINGSANTVTWGFDGLGRLTSEANLLGTFTYTYDGTTSRVATVTYPNSQTSTYSYFGNSGDRRLQTIHHKYPNATTLSKFDYTYDAVGNIQTWRQQADATAVLWEYGYDSADQLTAAIKRSTDPTPVVLKRYRYAYDAGGNRLAEQVDDVVNGATYNNVNELVSQQPAGVLWFEGTVNEPATVTIGGKPASVSSSSVFGGTSPVVSGSNTVAVTATDPSGNSHTNTYQVSNTGTTKTFAYDANGNLISDGTRTFEWDAANQLVAITAGTRRTELSYDGMQQAVRIVEKDGESTQSDTQVIWADSAESEERTSAGTVTRRIFEHGEVATGAQLYFVADHLGSTRQVSDNTATLLAWYDFDPWGRRTLISGSDVANSGFTGHRWAANGDLWRALYRGYDPALGRWLGEDPMRWFAGDDNLFRYVSNQPIRRIDPLGLKSKPWGLPSMNMLPKAEGCAVGQAAIVYLKDRHGKQDDRYAHCLASCLIAQKCPGGDQTARMAETIKELWDWGWCKTLRIRGSCDSAEQPTDYTDNYRGRGAGQMCPPVDCRQSCGDLRGAGPGSPGPHAR